VSTVRYFAYGSNMASATFRGRRGIDCRHACVARLAGWRLVLDKPPLIPVGHSFANIVTDAAAEVWGVLYEVTQEDLDHIDLTEGVLIDNYRRVELPVEPVGGPALAVAAFTLVSDRADATLLPSVRYMNLLISGAEEHGLPAAYVAWLRTLPARAESAEATAWQPVFDGALRRE
jgi:hypothetical protein